MTLEERYAATKVLAFFEGWEVFPHSESENLLRHINIGSTDTLRWVGEFTYHTSYDALWPVWVKFRDLSFVTLAQFTSHQLFEFDAHRERIARALAYDSIEKCFSLLVDAVSWYVAVKGGKA